MYQDSNLHGQMSKKLGLPQNHVKRNNISGQTQQQACHYHLAQAVITASQWKQWSLAGTLPGDVAILPFPFLKKIFIFSPSSDSISQNTAMRCWLPDREVKSWWTAPLEWGAVKGLGSEIHNRPLSAKGCRHRLTYRINTH